MRRQRRRPFFDGDVGIRRRCGDGMNEEAYGTVQTLGSSFNDFALALDSEFRGLKPNHSVLTNISLSPPHPLIPVRESSKFFHS
jgi:hypothetical protein